MRCTRRSHPWNHRQTRSPRVRALRDVCQKSDREIGICLCSACRLGLCCNAAPTIDNLIAGPCVKDWSTSHAERVGRPGPWPPPWAQGIAPLQPWRARAARRCRVPTRLRRVAPAAAAGVHSRANPDRVGTGPVGTGCGVPTRLRRVVRRRAGPARTSYRLRSGLCWVRQSSRQSFKTATNSR